MTRPGPAAPLWARWAAALAALTVIGTGCSYRTPDDAAEAAASAGTLPEVAQLDTVPVDVQGPTVNRPGPGTCRTVVYTPPTTWSPQEAELCLPSAEPRDVAIVLVHGGSGIGGDHTGVSGWAAQYLAEGYTTLAVDYTLFTPGVESPVFPVPEQNIKAAVQFLRGTAGPLGLDPERIVVHGLSAGARIGAVAYTSPDDPWFDGPELWPGIDDHVNAFIGFYSTYDGTHQYESQYYGGDRDDADPEVRRAWAAADAIVNAHRVLGPAAFFTGALDWQELVVQQEAFAERLEEAGYQSFTFVADGGEHGYDSTSAGMTPAGLVAASFLTGWLDRVFPPSGP